MSIYELYSFITVDKLYPAFTVMFLIFIFVGLAERTFERVKQMTRFV